MIADVYVSASGLIVGLLVGICIILIGGWAARETGYRIIFIMCVVVAILLFILLGFDFTDDTVSA